MFAAHSSLRLLVVTAAAGTVRAFGPEAAAQAAAPEAETSVVLPAPRRDSGHSLERALAARRSVREFRNAPIELEDISQLLWAVQGELARDGGRTAPSAGALYPLEVYVAAGNVRGLAAGVYRYVPGEHRVTRATAGDRRSGIAAAALHQSWLAGAAAIFVITAVERRTTAKYGERGLRYIHMEAGHAAQNLLLQAAGLGLGATPVGAFSDADVEKLVDARRGERALYLVPVGRPR
jgi:SagB-type dehydrogenase family enzyme